MGRQEEDNKMEGMKEESSSCSLASNIQVALT